MGNIPQDVDDIFRRLEKEVWWLQIHWKTYHQLFNHSKSRFQMLHECCDAAFSCIRNALETEILMSLCRLTDDDKDVLSLKKLHGQIGKNGQEELGRKLRGTWKCILKKRQQIEEHRNNRLAHLNREIALNERPGPGPIMAKELEGAITALQEYLSTIRSHFTQAPAFASDVLTVGDGETLVSLIRDGLRLRELIREGKVCPKDVRGGKWADVWEEGSRKASAGDFLILPGPSSARENPARNKAQEVGPSPE
ncbi:MAG: hypothetical protein AB1646_03745 [Thermodesulfobacteriota bacterium]